MIIISPEAEHFPPRDLVLENVRQYFREVCFEDLQFVEYTTLVHNYYFQRYVWDIRSYVWQYYYSIEANNGLESNKHNDLKN